MGLPKLSLAALVLFIGARQPAAAAHTEQQPQQASIIRSEEGVQGSGKTLNTYYFDATMPEIKLSSAASPRPERTALTIKLASSSSVGRFMPVVTPRASGMTHSVSNTWQALQNLASMFASLEPINSQASPNSPHLFPRAAMAVSAASDSAPTHLDIASAIALAEASGRRSSWAEVTPSSVLLLPYGGSAAAVADLMDVTYDAQSDSVTLQVDVVHHPDTVSEFTPHAPQTLAVDAAHYHFDTAPGVRVDAQALLDSLAGAGAGMEGVHVFIKGASEPPPPPPQQFSCYTAVISSASVSGGGGKVFDVTIKLSDQGGFCECRLQGSELGWPNWQNGFCSNVPGKTCLDPTDTTCCADDSTRCCDTEGPLAGACQGDCKFGFFACCASPSVCCSGGLCGVSDDCCANDECCLYERRHTSTNATTPPRGDKRPASVQQPAALPALGEKKDTHHGAQHCNNRRAQPSATCTPDRSNILACQPVYFNIIGPATGVAQGDTGGGINGSSKTKKTPGRAQAPGAKAVSPPVIIAFTDTDGEATIRVTVTGPGTVVVYASGAGTWAFATTLAVVLSEGGTVGGPPITKLTLTPSKAYRHCNDPVKLSALATDASGAPVAGAKVALSAFGDCHPDTDKAIKTTNANGIATITLNSHVPGVESVVAAGVDASGAPVLSNAAHVHFHFERHHAEDREREYYDNGDDERYAKAAAQAAQELVQQAA